LAASLIAFCLACMLIPHAGLESDEAVFGLATFGGLPREFSISVFRHQFPLMIFYYAGSLKGLLYWPVLHLFGPNVWSIRLPMALAGAATVALTFDFVRHISSRTVAAIAALMLATDPCFLITNTFDWGPVAMEHLLLMSSLALFARRRPQLA
jgi:4-amino-4-deoxy-L-arabinose transferase-like glycosyltransferase